MTDLAHGSTSTTVGAHVVRRVGGWAWAGPRVDVRKRPRGDGPARRGTRSVDRGQEAAGGAIEGEPSVLPGRALTQSREPLHVAPDRSGIRLVLFRRMKPRNSPASVRSVGSSRARLPSTTSRNTSRSPR